MTTLAHLDKAIRKVQRAENLFEKAAKEYGVTLRQSMVMLAVSQLRAPTQVEIVAATAIDRATLSDILIRLEANGLIFRETSQQDARAKVVFLTTEGLTVLVSVMPDLKRINKKIK